MLDGLLLAFLLIAWGAQPVLLWRTARLERGRRAPWAYAALILLIAGALAGLFLARAHPDEAAAAGLSPLLRSVHGRLLAVLFCALFTASTVTSIGWRKMEDAGWRIVAGFGFAFLAIAALSLELLRSGEGPMSGRPLLAAGCLLAAALGTGELAAPGRPALAAVAGLALPLYGLILPYEVSAGLLRSGGFLTLGAAALLLLGARWLPVRLRRPSLAAAALLVGLFLAQAAAISKAVSGPRPAPAPFSE